MIFIAKLSNWNDFCDEIYFCDEPLACVQVFTPRLRTCRPATNCERNFYFFFSRDKIWRPNCDERIFSLVTTTILKAPGVVHEGLTDGSVPAHIVQLHLVDSKTIFEFVWQQNSNILLILEKIILATTICCKLKFAYYKFFNWQFYT